MTHMEQERFLNLIQRELRIDVPLFYNNRPNSARLDLTNADEAEARGTVRSALEFLFGERPFWLCAYGDDSGAVLFENQLLQRPTEIAVVPYCSCVDRDWFAYDHDAIACAEVTLKMLALERYLDYVFRLEFLSNTVFLVDAERKLAAHVYDRRGMDVAARDPLLLAQFREQFRACLMEPSRPLQGMWKMENG